MYLEDLHDSGIPPPPVPNASVSMVNGSENYGSENCGRAHTGEIMIATINFSNTTFVLPVHLKASYKEMVYVTYYLNTYVNITMTAQY